jgi:MFS family permease
MVTKEISGGKFSQFIAACAMAASPTIIAFGGFYSMNAFEPLLAILLIFFAIKMIKENNPKRWIVIGIIMGIGMMNKHTFGVFIIAFILSLLVTGNWKLLFDKWFVVGGLFGFVIFLPNIIWQILNNYPSLEFYRNISLDKNVYTSPLAFIIGQIMSMSPSTTIVWLAGFLFLAFSKTTKNYRFLAILFISLFLFMILSGTSRSDRLAFAYPAVFAGGALFFEKIFIKYNFKWLKTVFIISLFSGLALALPIILPYFNYGFVEAQTKFLGMNTEIERGNKPPLPQLLADRIGWQEKFNLVLSAYNSLSGQDKKSVVIAANNYGQAGAIELFGKDLNLPPVVCGHNNYYLWSRDRLKGDILLQLGQRGNYNGLKRLFEVVDIFPAEYRNQYVTSHENNLMIFICRGPKISYLQMLEQGKNYY